MIEDRFKFRVWDSVDKRYYDVAALGQDRTCLEGIGWVKNTDGLTFEQCTGLKDKNNKLIYEGDIVKYHFGKNSFGVFDVVYDEKYAVYILQRGGIHCYDLALSCVKCKVVGNIHERIEE